MNSAWFSYIAQIGSIPIQEANFTKERNVYETVYEREIKMSNKFKMVIKKDRNPFVAHIKLKAGAGAHGKTNKATRRNNKMAMLKEINAR